MMNDLYTFPIAIRVAAKTVGFDIVVVRPIFPAFEIVVEEDETL